MEPSWPSGLVIDMFRRDRTLLIVVTASLALLLPLGSGLGTPSGSPQPADKVAAAGSDVQMLSADFADTDLGVSVLSTVLKTSSPTDLILQVSLECALWTEVISTATAAHPAGYTPFARAEAHVTVWIEVDGQFVPVSSGDPDGKVVFCDRVHEQEITDIDNSTGNFTLRQYLETRSANAFNWVTLNVDSGVHHVSVMADIEASNTEGSFADGGIGKRTLVIEPVKFPVGTTI